MRCMIDKCNGEAYTEVEAIKQINNKDCDEKFKIKICDRCLLQICDEERANR